MVVGLALAIAMAGVVLAGSAAEASCFPTDAERDLETSDLVFVGTVEELTNENRATFRVEEMWKGDPGSDRVEVRAGGRPGAPGASPNERTYAAGERYLVFASDLSRRPGAGDDFRRRRALG